MRDKNRHINLVSVVQWIVCIAISFSFPLNGYAQVETEHSSKSLLILHTNDIHDHLRADYDGVGGLPFVSGFVRQVKSQRDDVIVLDAGDGAEKGELVARRIRGMTSSSLERIPKESDLVTPGIDSDITFEAMGRVGYDAWTPGNHDYDFGIDALYRFAELAGMDIVCINLLKEDGTPEFSPSVVYEVNGIRVGVIGAIRPRNRLSLDLEGTAQAMAEEARRLKSETDVIFGLVHISNNNSKMIARTAPDIDVIFAAHSHEETEQPVVVPETGTLIVQAGSYAQYVGRLELEVNVQDRGIHSWEYRLVEMDHATIHPDLDMMEWVRQNELEHAPDALKVISWAPREVSYVEVGILAVEALRKGTNADIALHNTAHIIRATVPKGILDVNAFYRAGGERGEYLVEVDLTGSEINNYIQGLPMRGWYPTNWSGFYGSFDDGVFTSDLDLQEQYTVVMPEREWRQRFQRLYDSVATRPEDFPGITALDRTIEARDIDIKWIEAVTSLLVEFQQNETELIDGIHRIARQTGQSKVLQPEFLQPEILDRY